VLYYPENTIVFGGRTKGMNKDATYLLIDSKVVPEIFIKVLAVKRLLSRSSALSVNEAVQQVGLSRSAYYKYKDCVFPFYEMSNGSVMTILFTVDDISGILSQILSGVSQSKANILTIHQDLPINGLANITITIETKNSTMAIQDMLDGIRAIPGVHRLEVLSRK